MDWSIPVNVIGNYINEQKNKKGTNKTALIVSVIFLHSSEIYKNFLELNMTLSRSWE